MRPRAAAGNRRHVYRSQRHARRRGGFSLLEVILALAILVAALAVLGELIRSGVRNAQMARDLSRAQVLCETKLSEVFAGVIPAEKTSNSAIAEAPGWQYSIERDASGPSGLIKVHVTVEQDAAQQRYPVKFTLAQWIRDPTITATQWSPPVSAASQSGSSSQSGASSTSQRQ
ncbi:MAG TPA: prepilin-type N-terminal cleavage/methylation domain-containing protein [Pirellulales bacterium]|nr:prepilin-type N-terminal cleavage/methylation domain-containing protein [Pirellulales bacterium]